MNKVHLIGRIIKEPVLDHTTHNVSFMSTEIAIERNSGIIDIIPLLFPSTMSSKIKVNSFVEINGEFRSYNQLIADNKYKLKLYVVPFEVYEQEVNTYLNEITIDGFICKSPIFRKSLSGKTILELVIACNRELFKHSDYLPVIVWDRNAELNKDLAIGERVEITGTIHSRFYQKAEEIKTAYEVSANSIVKYSDFEIPSDLDLSIVEGRVNLKGE